MSRNELVFCVESDPQLINDTEKVAVAYFISS